MLFSINSIISRLYTISGLLRIHQWYKNIIVFLIIFLTGNLFNINAWNVLFLGFIALCFMSSTNYIINDIMDRKKDRLDSIKKKRPIASGNVSILVAIIVAIFLFIISLLIANMLSNLFVILLLILFGLTQIYTLWLKNKIFLDVVMIAINFMIRAVSGAVILGVFISSWFVSEIFFLAMLMVFAKRYGESVDGLQKNRKTLEFYTPELMKIFMIVFIAIVLMLYVLYIIAMHDSYWFVATIPVFTYLLLRYFALVSSDADLARHAEKLLMRKDLIIGGFVWLGMFVVAYYQWIGKI
jgi:4-hydroxybenzoate polyprenyltransferase